MHATTPASTETDETRTSRSQRWERAAALLAIVALHVFYLLSMDTVEIITHHGIGGDGSEGSGQMTGAKRKSRFVVYNEENPRTFFLRRRTLPERTRRRKKPDDATSSAHNAIVAGPEGRNLVPLGAATKGSNSSHKQQRRKRQTPKQARHRRHKAVEADAADGDVDDADEATVITSPLSGRHRRHARRGGDGEGVPMEVFDRMLKNGLYSDLRAEEENVSRRYHGRRTVPLITSTADPNRRRRHRHDDNVEDKLDRMLRKNLYTDLNRDTSRVPSSTSYSPRRRRRRHPQETDTSVGGEFDRMLPENLDGYLAADVITERHRTHLQPSSTTRNRHRRRRDSDDDRDVRKLFERMILRKNLFVEPEGRIVGGNEVRRRDYPYLVAVLQRQFNGRYAQRCGGALIAKNAVLSAAHCIPKADSVRIGAHRLEINNAAAGRSGVDDGSEGFDVVRTISHPDFDPVTLDNDFAIFVLGGNSTFPTIEVNSNPTEPIDGDDLRVLGWGVTRWGGAQSEVPREATVNRLADSLCSAKYDGSGAKITPKMLCAVAPQRDACQGDSGGPLVRRKRGVDALRGGGESQDVLVGLVSWGFGCANPSYPGVYARVSAVSSWINQTLQSFG